VLNDKYELGVHLIDVLQAYNERKKL
jgi:hypothetical protein